MQCLSQELKKLRLMPIVIDMSRAAKLSLLNFLSLFRDLQKPTRFSGGGVVAEYSFSDIRG